MQPSESSFINRLKNAGIEPTDNEQQRLNKSLLFFATGLISVTSMLWLAIYWVLGPQLSSNLPFAYQILLTINLLAYVKFGNFNFFRLSQLGLFLFMPFVVQWSIGNFIDASGIILWGLIAPVGAALCLGARQSMPWFVCWIALTLLCCVFDYLLADGTVLPRTLVPIRTSVVFFALNFIAVATIIYTLLRYSIQEKEKVSSRLEEAHEMLVSEQERSERLLLNILPAPIAERLKNSDQTIADGFADVTVMFADIVNFTQVAAHMAPREVFAMLNRIFSAFDELAEEFGLEKIKTIGDAYMVAGGLDDGVNDYTKAIANMALAMGELLQKDFSVNSQHLKVRIGIGTGPVVAGVVGKKKFIYDLWGDTVNIASRITSEGAPGAILCDEQTWRRLEGGEYEFSAPRTMHLKGRGDMAVYCLQPKRQNLDDHLLGSA